MFIIAIAILFIIEALFVILVSMLIESKIISETWRAAIFLPFILALIFQLYMLVKMPSKVVDFTYNKNPLYFGPRITSAKGIWFGNIVLLLFFICMFLVNVGLIPIEK